MKVVEHRRPASWSYKEANTLELGAKPEQLKGDASFEASPFNWEIALG